MSAIKSINSAIANSNSKSLEVILNKLSKEEAQELAYSYKAISAKFIMSGTWIEKCQTNLLDSSGDIIINDIRVERSFKGKLSQFYDLNNLHSAALLILDPNFLRDYDEDYFSPGEMVFGQDYGYGATSSDFDADCKSEERIFDEDELVDRDIDPLDCEVDDHERELNISNAYITVDRLIIGLDGHPSISIAINENKSYLVLWFLFSLLFISSEKTVEDLGNNSEIIRDFMSEYFQISV